MDFEMLEYGDRVELKNGDTCVYVRRVIQDSDFMTMQELNFVNVFTGEEHNINRYKKDLTHDADSNLDIKRFVN